MDDRSDVRVHQTKVERSELGMSKLDYNFQMLLFGMAAFLTIVMAAALGVMMAFLFLIG